jgi:hypothetical protein
MPRTLSADPDPVNERAVSPSLADLASLAATAAVTIAGTKPATCHRTTVFGDVPISDMKPEWTAETMPDHFQLRSGTFFEIGAMSQLATGSVERLRRLQVHDRGRDH